MRRIVSLKKPMNDREFATGQSAKECGKIICLHVLPKRKTFDTRDSRVVPHRSTDRAQWCLTAQFGWDAVYPPWCDRMMRRTVFSSMLALY